MGGAAGFAVSPAQCEPGCTHASLVLSKVTRIAWLTCPEVASGHVNHAIRVTFDSTRDAWVHPGSHCAGDTANPAAPPMGLRLRLRAGYSLARFTGAAKVIATALKRYGLIVADNGSNWYFGGTSDPRWNDQNLDQLKRIPGGAFQVIRSGA